MKKLFILLLLQSLLVSGQISTTPVHVTRPTPSVAQLMNFADIPVNEFTGVPNISIPLYNFPTRSKDINFNIGLNYHPASISFVDKASDVGLGWSLFAGGTIGRSVSNVPDDINPLIGVGNQNLFDDIYSFNFMGYSGSFLILRDANNNFSVQIKTDNNAKLKIEYNMNPTTLSINSFTIYDNKGYKYDFEIYDININKLHTFIPFQTTNANLSLTTPVPYRSAHHLTKVTDNNGKELINISYNGYNTSTNGSYLYDNLMNKMDEVIIEGYGKAIFNYSLNPTQQLANDILQLDNVTIKDLNSVTINKYSLFYSQTNVVDFNTGSGIRRLLSYIVVANKDNVTDLDYEFTYKTTLPEDIATSIENYTTGHDGYGYLNVNKNCDLYNGSVYIQSDNITPEYSSYGVLDRIRYPTGGSAIFDFESNTYSTGGAYSSTTLTDEDFYNYNQIDNVTSTVIYNPTYDTTESRTFQFEITHANTYYFNFTHAPYYYPTGLNPDPGNPYTLGVDYNLTNSNYSGNGYFYNNFNINNSYYNGNSYAFCIGKPVSLQPGIYTISIGTVSNLNTTGTITITEKLDNPTLKKWVYGAGIRIKQIAYFDTDVFPTHFNQINPSVTPTKHLKYEYNAFDDPLKSSGFLILGVTDMYSSYFSSEIGYTNVKVYTIPNNGYELFTFASPFENAPIGSIEWPHLLAYQNGNLTKKVTYSKHGDILSITDNVYEYVEENSIPFHSGLHFQSYLTRSSWAKLLSTTTENYFYPNQNSIITTENFTYNSLNKQLASKTMLNSLGENVTTNYTYDAGNSAFSQNRIAEIKSMETLKNGVVLSSSEIEYGFSLPNNTSYLPKTIRTSKDSQGYEDRVHYNLYDEYSNPLEIQQEAGTVTSYIWGYNKTQPIAKIENATNAQIATVLGMSFDFISEANMVNINNLRTLLSNAMVTTYTYIPLVGISTITDPKGDKLTYEYDTFNRLKWVKDKNNKILSENQYDYRIATFAALNAVKSTTYKVETETSIPSPTPNQAVINKTLFDGLGRPIQQIAHAQSASGKDIVTHIEYDLLGRKTIDYLPYANSTASLNYNPNAKAELLNYPEYVGQNPYSEKVLEESPLNRVLKQGAPGTDWAINPTGADHSIKFDYQANATSEVKKYRATSAWEPTTNLFDITFVDDGDYTANELYKSITKNENWTSGNNNTTHEFKDKEGRVILKRAFGVSQVNGVATNTIHDTYYVYDQYGNLTYVIPPLADGLIDHHVLDNMCYQYKYDYRNRLVEKKSPAKQWEYIVYDKLDRVIAAGPTLSPFPNSSPIDYGWTLTKFDALGRNILTAWTDGIFSSEDRKVLQESYNNTTNPLYETKSTSVTTINNVSFNYTNVSLPISNYHVLSVNYFDNYDYAGAPTTFSTVMHDNSLNVYYNNTTFKPKGLATGSWIRILEASTTLPVKADVSFILYDYKARAVRARTNNYLTGYIQVDSKIDFAGKVLYTETKHKRVSSDTEIYTREDFTYTNQDRLLTHIHKIGLNGAPQLLTKNEYNELGQLITKHVGGTDVSTFTGLQKVDYNYNIRGWLTAINDVTNLTQGTNAQDLFAFKINYNLLDTEPNSYAGTALYNGNISQLYWRSKSDNIKRKYDYEYDALNRLKNAVYQKPDTATPVTNSYNESMSYDKNGNITNLQRYGDLDASSFNIKIDNLVYTYDPDKQNQLMKVLDTEAHPEGFKDDSVDGVTDTTDDYNYDDNGNMISDQNKGITNITYNHLNLPVEIVFTANNKINYLYNAAGGKVKKTVTNGTVITHTYYVSGFQYTQVGTGTVKLDFFPHAEGYVNNTVVANTNVYNYVFNYTDHLGNVRMSYTYNTTTSSLKILEESHYYPYGLKHEKYNMDTWAFIKDEADGHAVGVITAKTPRSNYQYKLNGKEWQDELGLNMYAMDMRQYDPAIARWIVQDPVIHHNFSPYTAFDNNPVFWADPSGADSETPQVDMFGRPTRDSSGQYIPAFQRGPMAGSRLGDALTSYDGGTSYLGGGGPTEGDNDDDVRINTKTGKVTVADNGSTEDTVYIDGVKIGTTELGKIKEIFDKKGIKYEYYRAVGMGATDFGLSFVGATAVFNALFKVGSIVLASRVAPAVETVAPKLLNQYNSAESLIQAAGSLSKVKAGLQGFVKGDGASIFKTITQNGTLQSNGQYLMKNGTQIGSHFSKTTADFTIRITPTVGKMIKIRITP